MPIVDNRPGTGGGGGAVDSVNGQTGTVTLTKSNIGLANVDNTSDATKNAAVATLTNKTLTAPVINAPTGIVKADVGLSNVDNTSDATKNAAVATLTNKTLTAPVINAPTGIVKADVGLSNVDNTSDANKPVSTLQQAALDTKLSIIQTPDIEPNNFNGYLSYSSDNFFFRPLQNSPDESWNIFYKDIALDPDSTGFTMGTNGQLASIFNLTFGHQGTSDVGGLAYFSTNNNIGNGTDPIDVRSITLFYGFGNINANVTISNSLQGYGFQYNVDAAATLLGYITAFYDNCNINTATNGYTSFNSSPIIADVNNNTGVTAFNANPNIPIFSGNSSYTAFAFNGNLGATSMGTGGVSGVSINPTVSNCNYYNGIYSSSQNVTVFPGAQSSLVLQDLTFTFTQPGDNNSFTLEYTPGGTAGAEVVIINAPAIQVQIDSGVSTAAQIKAALEANPTANSNLTITVSGVGGNAQVTAGPASFTGGVWPGNKWAGYFDGDVNINGDLSFSGALSLGNINAFGTLNPIVNGGGNPASVHSLITQVFGTGTVANADVIAVNTAMLLEIDAGAQLTTALTGIVALGLPAVIKTGAGSNTDLVGASIFAASLDGASTGGTIGQFFGGRWLAIPNGITTIDRYYGVWSQLPFGSVATKEWGMYLEDTALNYIEGSLKIGGADEPDPGMKLHVEGDTYVEGTLYADGVSIVAVQVDCLDNATEQIIVGTSVANEVYLLEYVLTLNVSGKKITGRVRLGYDVDEAAVIFDEQRSYVNNDLDAVTLDANENAGNLRLSVDLSAAGENAKIRYTVSKVNAIV